MRDNFDRIAEVMWNQLKQTIPRLINGSRMGSMELFGETMPKGSMPPYRKRLIDAGIIENDITGRGVLLQDKGKALALLESPMSVAEVLWPTEASEWKALQEEITEIHKRGAMKTEEPVIPSKVWSDSSAAMAAVRLGPAKETFVTARPLPPPAPAPVPEVKKVEAAPEPTVDLVDIELAKMKLMHATAENMVYIRDRLDSLIKRPVPPPAPALVQGEVQIVKVPVLPKEIPVVLTVVNAAQIDARLEALEKQLTEVLTILRTLMS